MECFIVNGGDVDLSSNTFILRDEEARHAIRVLRLREGETLMATTLNGFCYRAKLVLTEQPAKNEWIAKCSIDEALPEYNESQADIQLIQGIPQQQSKLEEIVEKCTELGIRSIIPATSKRTEKKSVNHERMSRIIQTACKQVSRARMPDFTEVLSLTDALRKAHSEARKIFILHESAPVEDTLLKHLLLQKVKKITLVIGPEGGFDEDEIFLATSDFGATVTSLGPRRLRAETAAVVAVSLASSV
ncbi:MAG: RsmE family RNA methyltransferase [Ignavibacteriota bacterium]